MVETYKKKITIGVCPECKVRDGDSSRKKLYKCPYCGRYFCKKHIEPRLSTTISAIERIKDPVLRDKAYEEWRKPNGHPDWVWTREYFSKLEKEEKERREKVFGVLSRLKEEKEREEQEKRQEVKPIIRVELPPIIEERQEIYDRQNRFERETSKTHYHREYIDNLTLAGLFLCLVSLFLPWISISVLGLPIEGTWFSLFQTELSKIENDGLLNYIETSHYVSIAITIFPVLGFVFVIFGLLSGRNSIIFVGSLFLFFAPIVLLYFLSEGISVFGTKVSLVSLSGIGVWGFLVGSLLLSYSSGKQISREKVLFLLLIVAIVIGVLFSKFNFITALKIDQLIPSSLTSSNNEVKAMIEQTIKNYLAPQVTPFGVRQGSLTELRYFGPSFPSSFDGYTICATGTYACDYGKEKGENINYLYCKPTYFSSYIFCFKKTIVSASGEIKNIIKNCVYSFVLDPKNLEVVSIDVGPLNSFAESLC